MFDLIRLLFLEHLEGLAFLIIVVALVWYSWFIANFFELGFYDYLTYGIIFAFIVSFIVNFTALYIALQSGVILLVIALWPAALTVLVLYILLQLLRSDSPTDHN